MLPHRAPTLQKGCMGKRFLWFEVQVHGGHCCHTPRWVGHLKLASELVTHVVLFPGKQDAMVTR